MVEKRKKSKGNKPKGVNDFQRIVRSSRNNRKLILDRTVGEFNSFQIRSLSKQVSLHPVFKDFYLKPRVDFSLFYRSAVNLQLSQTVAWAESIILNSQNIINHFLENEKSIVKCILKKEFIEARKLLQLVESNCGKSVWGLQVESYLIYREEGVEKAKDYVKEEISTVQSKFARYVLISLSSRLDDDDFEMTSSELNRKLEGTFGDEPGLLAALKYRMLPSSLIFGVDSNEILSNELDTSVIDLYKAFIFCLTNEVYLKQTDGNDEWVGAAKKISESIRDPVLDNLLICFGELDRLDKFIDLKKLKLVDLYTEGKYSEVISEFEMTDLFYHDFSLYELYVKAKCRIKNNDTKICFLHSFLTSDGDTLKDYRSLFNDSFRLSLLGWFQNQNIFLSIYASNNSTHKVELYEDLYLSISLTFSAFKCKGLSNDVAAKVLMEIKDKKPASSSTELYELFTSSEDNGTQIMNLPIEVERKLKYLGIHYYNIEKYEDAKNIFLGINVDGGVLVSKEIQPWVVKSYLKLGEIHNSTKMLCESYFSNDSSFYGFPLELICENIESNVRNYNSIYSIICLHLYSEIFDDRYLTLLKISFETFVINNCKDDFLDLIANNSIPDSRMLEVFLEKIFVPSIMKGPIIFNNINSVHSTRIRVCQYLLEAEMGDKDNILEEIKFRSKEFVLRNAKEYVDNTKIYVDIDYVRKKVEKDCRSLFSRYQELLVNDYTATEDEKGINQILDGFENIEEGSKLAHLHIYVVLRTVHMVVDLNEKNKVFMALLKVIRDEFTDGLKGLAGYLSTRIKHNTLENHYKKAMIDGGLLKRSAAKRYSYEWSLMVDGLSDESRRKIDKSLIIFNNKFTQHINKILDVWLKVNQMDMDFVLLKGITSDALFNYSISNSLSLHLQHKLSRDSTFENFWKNTVDWLWSMTDENLKSVINKFESDLIPNFKGDFDVLQNTLVDISRLESAKMTPLLDVVTSSRQKLITSIRESKVWFSRNDLVMDREIDFDIVVEIVDRSLAIESRRIIKDDVRISGDKLSYFVDIIYILYANALKHGGLDKELIDICISVELFDAFLELTVSNSCKKIFNVTDRNLELARFNNIYIEETSLDRLKSEGGTGFYKVQKTIKEDVGSYYEMIASYSSQTNFSVKTRIYNENSNS